MTIETHNALRLGDNLVHLNFLRRAVNLNNVNFIHYCGELCSLDELKPFTEGLNDRIQILPIQQKPKHSIESWRGPYWYTHPKRLDFAEFHIEWFDLLSKQMGIKNPIKTKYDLLIDYPGLRNINTPKYDVIVINSQPLSGQFHGYNELSYKYLVMNLLDAGYSVLTTKATGLCPDATGHSVAWIGAASAKSKVIVGTSTGPSWACLNTENRDSLHILCLDTETVILTDRGRVARNTQQAIKILRDEGVL